jgi:protein TonB
MKKRGLPLLLAGLLLAGCDAGAGAEEYPSFPSTPPNVHRRPRPSYGPPVASFDHPLYRYPPRPDPNAPMRNPQSPAKLLERVEPESTPAAKRAGVTGIVILEVVIDTDGKVAAARVLKPLPFGLDEKALEAVRKWRFEPAKHRGQVVPCFQNVTVRFHPPAATQ